MNTLIDFFRDDKAATSIEYALIAAGISVVILGAVNALGSTVGIKFTTVKAALD